MRTRVFLPRILIEYIIPVLDLAGTLLFSNSTRAGQLTLYG